MIRLEVPLHAEGRVDEERLVVVGVVDEVITNLYLGTDAEMLGGIVPQLGLGEYYQLTVTVGLLATPEIDEAREGHILTEVQSPDASELE